MKKSFIVFCRIGFAHFEAATSPNAIETFTLLGRQMQKNAFAGILLTLSPETWFSEKISSDFKDRAITTLIIDSSDKISCPALLMSICGQLPISTKMEQTT